MDEMSTSDLTDMLTETSVLDEQTSIVHYLWMKKYDVSTFKYLLSNCIRLRILFKHDLEKTLLFCDCCFYFSINPSVLIMHPLDPYLHITTPVRHLSLLFRGIEGSGMGEWLPTSIGSNAAAATVNVSEYEPLKDHTPKAKGAVRLAL